MRRCSCWLVAAALTISGCTAATATTPPSSSPLAVVASLSIMAASAPTPLPSLTSTPAVTPTPTPTPTPQLPARPTLLATTTSAEKVTYTIAVAPLPVPMDQDAAELRSDEIGAAVGLGKSSAVWQGPSGDGDHWFAQWPASIQDIPIDPSFSGVLLEMYSDGTVCSFQRIVGPLAPRPSRTLTKAAAIKAAGSARPPDTADLVWSFEPSGSTELRLVWRLDWQNKQPGGEKWPCVAWLDAGTGEVLNTACVS